MVDVLLINPHWRRPGLRDRVRRDSGVMHPGLMQIAEHLLRNDVRVAFLDLSLDETLDRKRLLQALDQHSPALVAVTAATCSYPSAVEIASTVKQLDPALPIVGGGIHFALNAQAVLRGPEGHLFDFLCLSEGEGPTLELVRHLEGKQRLEAIRGIAYLDRRGEIRCAPPILPMSEPLVIDQAWRLLDSRTYSFNDQRKFGVAVNTMRGCEGRCTFCSEPYRWPSVTWMSAEALVRQFRIVKEVVGPSYIFVGDSNFCRPLERLRRFVQLMQEEKLYIPFNFLARLDDIMSFRDLLPDLRSIGCFLIHYGGERTTNQGQSYLRKGESAEITEEVTRALQEADILAKATFIFGMPFDDETSMGSMIEDIYRINPDIVSFGCYTPIPGTPSYDQDRQYISVQDLSYYTVNYAVCHTQTMSQAETESYLDQQYRRFWTSDRHRERSQMVKNEASRRLLGAYFDFIDHWTGR